MSFKQRSLLVALVLIVIVAIRIPFLHMMMTHVDDIGPMALFSEHSELSTFESVVMIRFFTYAPLQFFLTKPLIDLATSSSEALTLGRLPSLIAWAVGIYMLFLLISKLYGDKSGQSNGYWLLPIVIAIFSWRGIIESGQGYNYATTLPVACFIAYIFISEDGLRLLYGQSFGMSFFIGICLAFLIWITFQALFLLVACYLGIGLLLLSEKQKIALYRVFVSGIGFLVHFIVIYFVSLKRHTNKGVIFWAAMGVPPNDLIGQLLFVPKAWFQVWENNLSVSPWGVSTQIWTFVFISFVVSGITIAIRNNALLPHERRTLLMCSMLALVWTFGAFLVAFPLSPTRHTYVLQAFILLLVSIAAYHWQRISKLIVPALCGLYVIVFASTLPILALRLENHVDVKLINELATKYPNSGIVNLYWHFTWDHMLLLKDNPTLKGRVYLGESAWKRATVDGGFSTLILLSHRDPMDQETRDDLAKKGYTHIETIKELDAIGSLELSGNIAGGNGFYLYVAKRE